MLGWWYDSELRYLLCDVGFEYGTKETNLFSPTVIDTSNMLSVDSASSSTVTTKCFERAEILVRRAMSKAGVEQLIKSESSLNDHKRVCHDAFEQ